MTQSRFPALLVSVLTKARNDYGPSCDPELFVRANCVCRCTGGMYPYPHRHCANCGGKIELDGDAPVEATGRPVAVLPDGASQCAGCNFDLHDECADDHGFCILCHLHRHPADRFALDDDAFAVEAVPFTEDSRFADLRTPSADVEYARRELSGMAAHIVSCEDVKELLAAWHDLDGLVKQVCLRRADLQARHVALTLRLKRARA